MAGNINPIFEAAPNVIGSSFAIGDTTTKKTLFTAGANGSRVDAIWICTNDTTAVDLAFYITHSATDHYLGVVNVPIGSGYTSVAKVDGLTALLTATLDYLPIAAGDLLKAACLVTMTTAKVTDVIVQGGDY